MSNDASSIAEYPRRIASVALPVVFFVIGVGLSIAALVTLDSPETARTALLGAFGGLGVVAAVATAIDIRQKRARNERWLLRPDGIELCSAAENKVFPFAELRALEGKITVVQQTGARLHAYRLVFPSRVVELDAGELVGVDETTGRLLSERSGQRIVAWL